MKIELTYFLAHSARKCRECRILIKANNVYWLSVMHLLKSLVSGILLLTSVLWLGIQQLFLPNDIVSRLFVGSPKEMANFLQLRRDWCRVRSKKIGWRETKESCQSNFFMIDRRCEYLKLIFSGGIVYCKREERYLTK